VKAVNKALIIYGTRYGAAASTSEEIAKIFRQQGLDTKVVNAKKDKIKDISEYGLVVVGSGILINRWTGEPEDFIKKFQKDLANKKVALFVCCGSASQITSDPQAAEKSKQKYLDEKAVKFGLQPVALGFFGGVYNYNKVPWYGKKAMEMDKPRIEATYKQTEPGIYDTRDWNAIRSWAKELAQKALV
jgi:menaquinone-dependent protoporphyrinogen oxidase